MLSHLICCLEMQTLTGLECSWASVAGFWGTACYLCTSQQLRVVTAFEQDSES
jgi:hypothetical protein